MTIEWPGSHACKHGEQGPQFIGADSTNLIWDLFFIYKTVYVHNKLYIRQSVGHLFNFRLQRNDYQDCIAQFVNFVSD